MTTPGKPLNSEQLSSSGTHSSSRGIPTGGGGAVPTITFSRATKTSSTNMTSDRTAADSHLSSDTQSRSSGSQVSSNRSDVITQQPKGVNFNPGLYTGRDKSLRSESEEHLLECLNCATVTVCCPCIAALAPFALPKDYERTVIFRIGKLRRGGARGPGIIFINPFFDEYKTVDMRVETVDVLPQEVITNDAVLIRVDAVLLYRVLDAVSSCCDVMDFRWATIRLAEGTLRSVLANFTLSELLARKAEISQRLHETVEETTRTWGVSILALEIKSINLPIEMIRAMSTEAQTEKQALGNVMLAQGEEHAAEYLSRASACLADRSAVTLRSLKTLVSIAQKTKSLTFFPIIMPEGYWLWE